MCGIVGYIGDRQAQPVLLECLQKLEYRGYDSCGIAVANGKIDLYKDAVRVEALSRASPHLEGQMGIGHTRWATHGPPSRANAHPHLDCTGRIAVVHNGVVSNYEALRRELIRAGHRFVSETDTEVIVHLIESAYTGSLEEAVAAALRRLEGSYAIAAIAAGEPRLVVARRDSPLIVGVSDGEYIVASDVPAVLDHTGRVLYLEDGDIAVVTREGVSIQSHGAAVDRTEHCISWNVQEARRGGFEHFMRKEIHEEPRVVRDTLGEYARESNPTSELFSLRDRPGESVLMLACGTSYHSALIGKYAFEALLQVPARVELASEFNYYANTLARCLAIAITQSGETADTLKAMRRLTAGGCPTIAITNVVGSTASRVASRTIYTRAGPEISVAATKSMIGQLMVLYLLAMQHSRLDPECLSELLFQMRRLPTRVQQVIDTEEEIASVARVIASHRDVFFIGRGINYPVALEGALKLKEISYLHAEGYAAGETKHGPLALLGEDTPVVAVVARDNTHEAMLTSIKEIKARGSPVLVVAEEGDEGPERIADWVVRVPRVHYLFSPVLNIVALQMLAYHAARELGCPIDYPRNLAKSVTVE